MICSVTGGATISKDVSVVPEGAMSDEVESVPEEEGTSWVKGGIKTVPKDEGGFLEDSNNGGLNGVVKGSNDETFESTLPGEEIEFFINITTS